MSIQTFLCYVFFFVIDKYYFLMIVVCSIDLITFRKNRTEDIVKICFLVNVSNQSTRFAFKLK